MQTMDFILQSRRVIKGTEYKPLKIDETGDNLEASHSSTPQTASDQKDLPCIDTDSITYSELRSLPVYSDKAATTLGLKYSSRVSRSGPARVHQERATCGPQRDSQHLYNVFEDPRDLSSVKGLPHPSELFGKGYSKRKGIKRKEQPNSVQFHISQLRTKRERMKEEIDDFKQSKTSNKSNDEVIHHKADKEEDSRQNKMFIYDTFEMEPHFIPHKRRKRREE